MAVRTAENCTLAADGAGCLVLSALVGLCMCVCVCVCARETRLVRTFSVPLTHIMLAHNARTLTRTGTHHCHLRIVWLRVRLYIGSYTHTHTHTRSSTHTHTHLHIGLCGVGWFAGVYVCLYIAHDLQTRREENTRIQAHTHSLNNCFENRRE